MIPFIRKMFTVKKSNSQFEKIQDMEMKKKELQATLNRLKDLEDELRSIKKNDKK
ncbi:hypothetical protein GCM10009430_43250 [Aquimarina litoralis]|uniref:Uncharacterized protein n=1 Tax=Aquimarina litoralis TaxID=584605 RepID=A0ABN1J7Q4_9FLAO